MSPRSKTRRADAKPRRQQRMHRRGEKDWPHGAECGVCAKPTTYKRDVLKRETAKEQANG